MIPNQWYPLFASKKLRRKPVGISRMGEKLVLWRDASGTAVCMRDTCPHRNVALSRGKVVDGKLQCGYHGFRFDGSGQCVLMPCEGPDAKIPAGMRAHTQTVREAHGLIWLFWGEASGALPEIPWFDEFAGSPRGTAAAAISWPINYVRSVETNFDIHHTRFVHGNVLPGLGTRVDPYHVEVEGNEIKTWGELRKEGAAQGIPFTVQFKAPSVTWLTFGKLSFVVADCPVDDTSTWRYAVYRQDYVKLPGIATLLSWLSMQGDWRLIQLRQDLRMVETFTPELPEEHRDRLVHADAGTAAYRKLRRKLIAEAGGSVAEGDAPLRRVS